MHAVCYGIGDVKSSGVRDMPGVHVRAMPGVHKYIFLATFLILERRKSFTFRYAGNATALPIRS